MSAEINRLINEQQRTADELRHSEFRALQAQINPHFLYNTLDLINWGAMDYGCSCGKSAALIFPTISSELLQMYCPPPSRR